MVSTVTIKTNMLNDLVPLPENLLLRFTCLCKILSSCYDIIKYIVKVIVYTNYQFCFGIYCQLFIDQ